MCKTAIFCLCYKAEDTKFTIAPPECAIVEGIWSESGGTIPLFWGEKEIGWSCQL